MVQGVHLTGSSQNVATAGPAHDPAGLVECERGYAEVLAGVVGIEQVSVDSDFFAELGADSMVMARFCARVRKRPGLPVVSMPDVYQHPTVRSLAAALAPDVPAAGPNGNGSVLAECEQGFAEVLAGVVGVEQVSVDSDFFAELGADSMVMARFCARVRKRPGLPVVSMPDVYQHPTVRSLAAALVDVPAAGPNGAGSALADGERGFAEVLAGIVGTEQVSVDANFFDDLGADSMVMARFCARVRKRDDLPAVSMPDVYQHPTVRSLAEALVGTDTTPAPSSQPVATETLVETPRRAGSLAYVACGAVQLLVILGYPFLTAIFAVKGYEWVSGGTNPVGLYLRAVAFGGALFFGLCAVPLLLKWVLIGRWKSQEIRIWSVAYLRFWVVRTLLALNPMSVFVGSPLYTLYLRSMGAKVGRGAVIFAKAPVCTDLLSIGAGAVIRKDSLLNGYRADDGIIRTGPVSIGKDALVGEASVLDIWTSVGDGSQLGHSSSLQPGQSVPDGEHWHGSPAQPTSVDYQQVPAMHIGSRRRVVFATVQLANLLLLGAPLAYVIVVLALTKIPRLTVLLGPGTVSFTSSAFLRDDALLLSTVLFFGAALLGLVFVRVVPRVLNHFIEPDTVYPLYGVHHWIQRAIARTSNIRFYMRLFGDTVYIVHYLRWVGYDLRDVRQTGSNFGEVMKHDNPFLNSVGSGTMVADGLSIMNTDFSSTSFRLSHVSIGAESFLGNRIAYPPQARTGDNCLLATRVMLPIDGQVRSGVGLLGAPSFEIPRLVRRDAQFGVGAEDLHRGLKAKTAHNNVTLALMLLSQWFSIFVVTVLYLAAVDFWDSRGALAFGLATDLVLVFAIAYNLLLDRLVRPLMALRPHGCSIYDRAFWRHERYWKIASIGYLTAFAGTPLRPVLLRLLGARIGRRVFDDGVGMPERRFTTVGDDCTLNAGSVLQCHSQEDGGFKSDRIVLGNGCTLGVGSWVHYGVTMGDGAVIATSSFLMKGEEVPPDEVWGGNPARKLHELPGELAVPHSSIDALVRGG